MSKFTAIHTAGPKPCNCVAFWYDHDEAIQDMIAAELVTLPDGSKPKPGDSMRCGACGELLAPLHIRFVPGEYDEVSVS